MGGALAYLLIGVIGVLAVRYGESVVAVVQRLNEVTHRRLPRACRVSSRHSAALHAVMTYMLAGWGYMCIVVGLVGIIYSVDAEFR